MVINNAHVCQLAPILSFRSLIFFSFVGGVDSGVADLLIAGGPPTSSGVFVPYLSGSAFPPCATYSPTLADGSLVESQLDSLTESLATHLCRGAVKQDAARTRF